MADHTHIEWTDATWNPVTGCSVVSPGCANCYAMKLAGTRLRHHPSRQGLTTPTKAGPVWNGQVRLNAEWLDQPLRWARPRRIFVCAHGDLFHEDVPDAWIDQVFAVMALSPQHTFQVLTKRAGRMREYLSDPRTRHRIYDLVCDRVIAETMNVVLTTPGAPEFTGAPKAPRIPLGNWPLSNVWLGVSAEDQPRADERIPELLATPAAFRFVSIEPMVGPVDLSASWTLDLRHMAGGTRGLDWVILGGESGPGARPMHPDWARRVRDDCAAAGVPFFFKQWGAFAEFEAGEANRVVEVGSDEAATILEFMGAGRCAWVHSDGRVWRRADDLPEETPARLMVNVGKKAAGRLLDGVQHDGMPRR